MYEWFSAPVNNPLTKHIILGLCKMSATLEIKEKKNLHFVLIQHGFECCGMELRTQAI